MMSLPVWFPGPMFFPEGLCLWSHVPSRGVFVQEVSLTETPLDRDPLDRDTPVDIDPPVDRQMLLKTLASCNFVCGL